MPLDLPTFMIVYRDSGTIEEHGPALVSLLESCLQHDLKPSKKDEDPPHAKIVSDLVSCIFLNHNKKSLMKIAIPVAVKLLHRGNKELSRNLSSYLSIAVLQNAEILANHIQPIIDSIIGGNYSLVRVLPRIYSVRKEPIHDHVMALVCLLPHCETPEKLSLLNLFALISKNNASILESNLPQLSECLAQPQTASPTLQIFLDMAQINPKPFGEYTAKVVAACDLQNGMLWMAAQFLGIVGKLNIDQAYDCVGFLVFKLEESDLSTTITLLREIKSIAEFFPSILPSFMHKILRETEGSSSSTVQNYLHTLHVINQQISPSDLRPGLRTSYDGTNNHFDHSSKGASICTPSSGHYSNTESLISPHSHAKGSYGHVCSGSSLYNRCSHTTNDSGNYGTANTALQRHYSSSSNGFHRSLNALNSHSYSSSSRHQINRRSIESIMTGTNAASSQKSASSSYLLAMHDREMSKTVGTSVDSQLQQSVSGHVSTPSGPSSIYSSHYANFKLSNSLNSKMKDLKISNASYTNTEHLKQSKSSLSDTSSNRDAVQHFCEKHFDKIKSYMQKISVKIPLPVRCTIEEKKAKKIARLHFVCGGKGTNCLYTKTYFTMKTRNARIWIHIMFLALQSKASNPLCTSEPSVGDLKKCWDTIKTDNRTFLTLVTSSFPSAKDQDILINELRSSRYFDVFEFNAPANMWGCFLCNYPDRANEYLQESEPIIEGHLKEKKSGKWKLFRRWRTHYFTLSGLHLSYRETVS